MDPKIVSQRPLDIVIYGLGQIEAAGTRFPNKQIELLAYFQNIGFQGPAKVWTCHHAKSLGDVLNELDAFKMQSKLPLKENHARFVCTIAYFNPSSSDIVITSTGDCQGQILSSRRGTGGFGYDPVLKNIKRKKNGQ